MKKMVIKLFAVLSLLVTFSPQVALFASENSNKTAVSANAIPDVITVTNYTTRTVTYPKGSLYLTNYNKNGVLYKGTVTRTSVRYDPDVQLYFASYKGQLSRQ